MTGQRRTLVRTRDLGAFRAAIASLAPMAGAPLARRRRRAVIVPTHAAAELLRQTLERQAGSAAGADPGRRPRAWSSPSCSRAKTGSPTLRRTLLPGRRVLATRARAGSAARARGAGRRRAAAPGRRAVSAAPGTRRRDAGPLRRARPPAAHHPPVHARAVRPAARSSAAPIAAARACCTRRRFWRSRSSPTSADWRPSGAMDEHGIRRRAPATPAAAADRSRDRRGRGSSVGSRAACGRLTSISPAGCAACAGSTS